MAWGKVTEWGYRTSRGETVWCTSKGEANRKLRRINNKTGRSGITAKLIQHQVPKPEKPAKTRIGGAVKGKIPRPKRNPDPCAGGKCNKRGNVCKKHFRGITKGKTTGKEWSLDGINARWDEEGHRWG